MSEFRDLDSCWSWLVMLASFVSLFVIGGTNFTVGLVHSLLLEQYKTSQTTTALVGAVHSSVSNLFAPLSSFLIDRFSVRVAMVTGGLLYTVGFISTAFVSSIEMSVFTFGVVAGLGGAMGWTASMLAPNFHFQKYRNLAQGISISGIGAGMFGIPPIMTAVSQHYGYFGFFVALACVSAQFIVCGMVARPSSLEKHSRIVRHSQNKRGNSAGILTTYYKVLTRKSVLCYTISMFAYAFGTYIVFVFLPTYCIQQGSTEAEASFIVSVCGVASICGRILVGFIANFKSVNEIFLYSGSAAILMLTTLFCPLYAGTFSGQLVYAVILGVFFGCPYVTITPINFNFVGVGHISAALGIELCGCGGGGIIGPILAGVLVDNFGSFTHVFILAGVAFSITSVFGLLPYFFKTQSEGTKHLTISMDVKEKESIPGTKLLMSPLDTTEPDEDVDSNQGTSLLNTTANLNKDENQSDDTDVNKRTSLLHETDLNEHGTCPT